MFGAFHIISRGRGAVPELNCSGEDAVVFPGCHCVDRLLNGKIAGTACLRVVDGTFSLHPEPVCHLNIGCQIVGAV